MNSRLWVAAAGAAGLALSAAAWADDLTGQDRLLCSAVQVTQCTTSGDCRIEPPWNLNIPQFIEVNLKDKTFSTTRASGENRMSPIRTLAREDGEIVLQGFESGRAFSFVIEEDTGMASIAVAREGMTVSVFGACTPMTAAAK